MRWFRYFHQLTCTLGEMKLLEIIDETKLTTAQKQEKLEDLGKVIGMLEAYDRIMKFVEKEINIANNETE